MKVSRIEVITLGLLAEGVAYGYELFGRAIDRGMPLWTDLSKASIYQALRRLEAEGMLDARTHAGREGPDRRVYRLLRPGREALRRGLAERFGAEDPDEATLAMSFAHVLGATDLKKGIVAREAALAERSAVLAEARANVGGMSGAAAAVAVRMIDRERDRTEADIAWLGAFKRSMTRRVR